jgi:hypothetical protein
LNTFSPDCEHQTLQAMRFASTLLLIAASSVDASSDLRRARQAVPGSHVIGEGHVGMTVKLNAALKAMPGANLKSCDEFSVQDLVNLQRKIHQAREPALEAVYRENGDNGRRMSAFGVFTEDLKELEELWGKELIALTANPELQEVSRDTKCHEAIMWYVHHVPQAMQVKLRLQLTLPLLPERERRQVHNGPVGISGAPLAGPGGLGCDVAHAQQSTAKNDKYVEWPQELTYTALGHGAFPFWDNGGPGCSHCDPSVSGGAQLKVKYSAKLNSEILMHAACGDMTWTKSSGAPNKSPCNHIFTPDQGAFIYTPKTSLEPEADGKFCCRSVQAGSKMFTGAVPRDWMKTASYAGTYANFAGDHYSGPIEMFTWSEAGLSFWYYTQPDGTPVQQGEGCYQPGGKKPQACDKMMPIVLYHDFDPSTFKNATFTQSDYAVPDVCKSTTVSCAIPGGSSHEVMV